MSHHHLQSAPSAKEKALHKRYGHSSLQMIRGAGKLHRPDLMLVFMNPTARNVSADPAWRGLRAPWLGVKKIWNLLADLGLIDEEYPEDADALYEHVADRGLFITNLASCTQPDARHLPDAVFRDYLPVIYDEISKLNPRRIITFGNQVSSVLLQQPISVSAYTGSAFETLELGGRRFKVYPSYYPVGQGQRNMPKALARIRSLIA